MKRFTAYQWVFAILSLAATCMAILVKNVYIFSAVATSVFVVGLFLGRKKKSE